MAQVVSILPADTLVITPNGGIAVTLDGDDIVAGSLRVELVGDDGDVTTADGNRHYFRRIKTYRAEAEVWTDRRADVRAPNGKGLPAQVDVKNGSVTVATFFGVVSASYSDDNRTTRISIEGTDAGVQP